MIFASLSILALCELDGVGLLPRNHTTEGILIVLYCQRRLV